MELVVTRQGSSCLFAFLFSWEYKANSSAESGKGVDVGDFREREECLEYHLGKRNRVLTVLGAL